jgi:hypothetical protein
MWSGPRTGESGIPPQVFVFGTAIFMVGILCAVVSIVVSRRRT